MMGGGNTPERKLNARCLSDLGPMALHLSALVSLFLSYRFFELIEQYKNVGKVHDPDL